MSDLVKNLERLALHQELAIPSLKQDVRGCCSNSQEHSEHSRCSSRKPKDGKKPGKRGRWTHYCA